MKVQHNEDTVSEINGGGKQQQLENHPFTQHYQCTCGLELSAESTYLLV